MVEERHQTDGVTTVGILYPGHSAEDDYPRLEAKLGGRVRLPLAHTALRPDAYTIPAMKAAGHTENLIEGSLQLADEQLDSLMLACTSGSFTYGWNGAAEQAYCLYESAAVPASSTSFAFVEALHHIDASRVAIAAAYPGDLTEKFREFLAYGDIDIRGVLSANAASAAAAGEAGEQTVFAFVDIANRKYPDTEAILLPDAALHTAEWLSDLETYARKPVLTANQVTVWYGLRLAGDKQPREGLGSVFAD